MERRVIIAFLISMLFLSFYNAIVIKPRLEARKKQILSNQTSTDVKDLLKTVSKPKNIPVVNSVVEDLVKKGVCKDVKELRSSSGWIGVSDAGICSVFQKVEFAAVPVKLDFKLPVFLRVGENKTVKVGGFRPINVDGNILQVQLDVNDGWFIGPQLPHVNGLPTRYAKYYEGVVLVEDNGRVRRIPSYKFKETISGSFRGIGLYSKYYICYISLSDAVVGEVRLLNIGDSIGMLFRISVGGSAKRELLVKFYGGLARKSYMKGLSEAKMVLKSSWLSGITNILWFALRLCYRISHNWGLAIVLLAILFSLVFMPLTLKSYSAMKKLQAIQPKIKALQEKYKDDPQRLNQELLMLYATYGVNPFSGCLPLLIQLPVFFSLYPLLLNTYEFKNASFLWIKDLSMPDNAFHIGDFQVNLLPLIVVGLMSLQQRFSLAKSQQTQNQAMMLIFPLIFLLIFYNMPSGLVLFWLVLSTINFAQQYYLTKVL